MKSNWQANFFRGVALEAWRRIVSPEQTRAEVDFLERVLVVRSAAQLLDIPCGNGRHAIELAKRGYRMTGMDLSEEFIADAREANSAVRWVQGDMCELPWLAEFDGAYCFGNSFGYLDPDGARKFLSVIARALKPGARFVVDTGMAAESILPVMPKGRWFKIDDIFMLSEHRYEVREGRLDIQYTFIRNGEVETRPSASYVFTVAEMCRMHSEAGLDPVEMLASTAGEAYQVGSPRLLLISAKR